MHVGCALVDGHKVLSWNIESHECSAVESYLCKEAVPTKVELLRALFFAGSVIDGHNIFYLDYLVTVDIIFLVQSWNSVLKDIMVFIYQNDKVC